MPRKGGKEFYARTFKRDSAAPVSQEQEGYLSPHFTLKEMLCQHTGNPAPHHVRQSEPFRLLLEMLEYARNGSPLRVTSWHRHRTHPLEAAKKRPGPHTTGLAVDVAAQGSRALEVVSFCLAFCARKRLLHRPLVNFLGLGVCQHGSNRFVHIDLAAASVYKDGAVGLSSKFPRPMIWSYP